MGTALEVVSTIMLVLSVVRFVLSVFNILVAVLPTFSVVFLSVVVVFGDVTEAGNQRKCHQKQVTTILKTSETKQCIITLYCTEAFIARVDTYVYTC